MSALVFLVAGYLAGSVPYGLIVTRAVARRDVRTEGSGNIGATNVARVAGRGWGVLVLALDALKGAAPVWGAMRWAPDAPWLHVSTGLAAFAGHVFPVWLGFRGGKGVATALGVLAVLLPTSAALGFGVWLVVLALTRVSSLGSLAGGATAVAWACIADGPRAYAALSAGLLAAMLWTHRGNLGRLLARTERRL